MDTPYVTGSAALAMEHSDFSQDERVQAGDTVFRYNKLGLGIQRKSGSNDIYYIRDNQGTLIGMREDVPNNDDDVYHYYLFDGLGSVAGLVDESQAVQAKYAYGPYGETSCVSTCVSNPWRFASGFYDTQTRLYKFGTRYYDPHLMRWTQIDPHFGSLSDPMTLNRYMYVGGNPVNVTDPSGRFFSEFEISGCIVVLCGEVSVGLDSEGFSVGVAAGPGVGFGVEYSTSVGPGEIETGMYTEAGCSGSGVTGSVSSARTEYGGSVGISSATKLGCDWVGGYTGEL